MKKLHSFVPLKDESSIHRVSEVRLSYITKIPTSKRVKILGSQSAEKLFRNYWSKTTLELTESFKVLFLSRNNMCLALSTISEGGITGTVVDPKIVYAYALKLVACAIILCHNHPSGSLKPSKADMSLTTKLVAGGKLLDIQVLDHIILNKESFLSMADEGML